MSEEIEEARREEQAARERLLDAEREARETLEEAEELEGESVDRAEAEAGEEPVSETQRERED